VSEQKCIKTSDEKKFNILKGIKFIIISYITSLILIFTLTALIVYTDVPEGAGSIGVGIITFFGSFLSGLLFGRSTKRGGLLWGAIQGILNILGLFLLGFAIYGETGETSDMIIKILGGCICGAIGGIIGVNTGKE